MDVLKKISSATLMEALIATVLIIVVFVMASMVLNNLLLNTFSKNTHDVEYRMNELDYAIQNNKLSLPYKESYKDWEISIQRKVDTVAIVLITAINTGNDKTVLKKRMHEE